MSEFIYQIPYQPGTQVGKSDVLSWRSGQEKSGMEGKFFDEGQLMVFKEVENVNEGEAEDWELDGIDIAGWEKRKGLWVVTQ